MREFWYDVVKEKYHGDQSAFEKLNETLVKLQHGTQAEMEKLRSEVIEEVKVIQRFQEQAAEQLKSAPVVDIVHYANSVVGSSSLPIVSFKKVVDLSGETEIVSFKKVVDLSGKTEKK